MKRIRTMLTVAFASLAAACPAPREPVELPSTSSSATAQGPVMLTPCEIATRERERAQMLLSSGLLDRTVRVLDRADGLCPSTELSGRVTRLGALAELRRDTDARALMSRMSSPGDATPEETAAVSAATTLLEKPDNRSVDQLFDEAMAEAAKGQHAAKQRLLDRAMAALETETKQRVVVELPGALRYDAASFAWAPDGRALAEAAKSEVSIREARFGFRESRRLAGCKKDVVDVKFAPKSALLAAACSDNTIRLYDSTTWSEKATLVHDPEVEGISIEEAEKTGVTWQPPDFVDSIVFSPDGSLLVSASGDGGFGGNIRVWDPAKAVELHKLDDVRQGGSPPWFSRDGKTLFADSYQAGVRSWNPKSGARSGGGHPFQERSPAEVKGEEVAKRWQPKGRFGDALLSPDGAIAAVVSDGTTVNLLEASTAKLLASVAVQPEKITAMAFSPDGKTLAVDGYDGVTLLESRTGKIVSPLRAPSDIGSSQKLALSGNGVRVVTGGGDRRSRRWTMGAGFSVEVTSTQTYNIARVALSSDGSVHALSVGFGSVLWSDKGHRVINGQADVIAVSPDGKTFATADDDAIRLFDTESFEERRTIKLASKSDVGFLGFSPNGEVLTASTKEEQLYSLNVATGASTMKGKGRALASSPDGKWLATVNGNELFLTDAKSGNPHDSLARLDGIPLSAAFSRDASALATVSPDGLIRLWDTAKGGELSRFDVEGASNAVFSGNDQLFIGAGDLGLYSRDGKKLLSFVGLTHHSAGYAFTPGEAPLIEIAGPQSDAAREALRCRAGARVYPFALCRERYEVDDLVQDVRMGSERYLNP